MLNKFFKLDGNNANIKTEVIAGITTFLTMSYILGVNHGMLSQTGMSLEGVFIATALASSVACIIMGLLANYPVGLTVGMGLNAIFYLYYCFGYGYVLFTAACCQYFYQVYYFSLLQLLV